MVRKDVSCRDDSVWFCWARLSSLDGDASNGSWAARDCSQNWDSTSWASSKDLVVVPSSVAMCAVVKKSALMSAVMWATWCA